MLVLRRKRRQKILIGRNIILTVLGTARNGVRLGIEAPADMTVLRDELLDDDDVDWQADDWRATAKQGRGSDHD